MSTPLYVTASFSIRPGTFDATRTILAELSERTREEPGCLEYGYYQSLDDPLRFCSFEVWRSAAEEAAHWQTAHLRLALEQVAPLLHGSPSVTRALQIA
ncbi:putative quinol monooxygenase [Pseudomonas japonica]|uniref:putative quinol monooxygenase n=1 Tax=Pseudomonas TaxID=286 RepID=UPI002927F3F0|nr:putative quinol monooxygenase [Pseudomonas sp. zfem002]MDU9394124.1 putative quinol monooxygenase [Pseudomonas sp. zfem002]